MNTKKKYNFANKTSIYEVMNINIIKDKERRNRLRYITYIIPKFSDAYKMDRKKGYLYLKKYGGLDFLFEHWWALHTDSTFWAVRSLYNICNQNGGAK